MRSRLHSDIGRFTDRNRAAERERQRERERKRGGGYAVGTIVEGKERGESRKEAPAILAGKIELGFARVSRLLFASVIRRVFRESNGRDQPRDRSAFLLTSLVPSLYAKFDAGPPRGQRTSKLDWTGCWYSPETEREKRRLVVIARYVLRECLSYATTVFNSLSHETDYRV